MLAMSSSVRKTRLKATKGMIYVVKDVVKAPRTELIAPKKGKATATNMTQAHRGSRNRTLFEKLLS